MRGGNVKFRGKLTVCEILSVDFFIVAIKLESSFQQ